MIFTTVILGDSVSEFKDACIATCAAGDLTCLTQCNQLAADQQAQSQNTTSMLFLTDCLRNCKPQDEMCRNMCITMDPTYRYSNLPNVSWINNLPTQNQNKDTTNNSGTVLVEGGSSIVCFSAIGALVMFFQ